MTTPPEVPMADISEMYLVHTMFRREFSLLPDLIRGAGRDAKRRARIGAHAQLLCQILHPCPDLERRASATDARLETTNACTD
jgi:hypothetical protein